MNEFHDYKNFIHNQINKMKIYSLNAKNKSLDDIILL